MIRINIAQPTKSNSFKYRAFIINKNKKEKKNPKNSQKIRGSIVNLYAIYNMTRGVNKSYIFIWYTEIPASTREAINIIKKNFNLIPCGDQYLG